MADHKGRVNIIAQSVRRFYDRKEPFRIYHGSTNNTHSSSRRRDQLVDTSKLNHILQIDVQAKEALVEPNVPMDDLVEATLRHGLVPPVIMEFPGITVGGGFAGQAGESSSFRYGLFDKTITWLEIVLANGEVVTATKSLNSDLFSSAAASFGTLGVTTLLKIELIKAKPYVELKYHLVASMLQGVQMFESLTEDASVDYVDGIMYSSTSGVVCSGRLTDVAKPRVQRFTRATNPWFYLHAKAFVSQSTNTTVVESIPITDYLFRYDRGTFWTGRYAFHYFVTPFNRLTRWALDKFMHTRVMYHALHQSGLANQYMIQDVSVPYHAASEFMDYLDQSFGHYPIWIVPLSQSGKSAESGRGLLVENPDTESPDKMINFGVWGPGSSDRATFVKQNRELEDKVQALNGRKWLYAHTFYTEEQFWSMFDRERHDKLRNKYHASYLPTVYDKVKAKIELKEDLLTLSWTVWLLTLFWSVWPFTGLYGVYKVLAGGEYLLPGKPLTDRSHGLST